MVATLHANRAVIDELISRHRGRIFGTAGDSVVAELGSAIEAVRCAVEIQEEMTARNADVAEERRMRFRIGIDVGDVIVDGENLLGDRVNVAARLEGLAEAGGVCVSGGVFDQVRGKISVAFQAMGPQKVKNIADAVLVYRVKLDLRGAGFSPEQHGWERYDRPASDIFAAQDDITERVAAGLIASIRRTEMDRAAQKATESLEAWERVLRARHLLQAHDLAPTLEARRLLERAAEIDPNYAPAYAWASYAYSQLRTMPGTAEYLAQENLVRSEALADKAIALNGTFAAARSRHAVSLMFLGKHRVAEAEAGARSDSTPTTSTCCAPSL